MMSFVEEFVDGPEFSIETLTHAGTTKVFVAVTDKLTSGAPYFVELGHNQPSRWSTDQVELLCDTAIQAVTALGIDRAAGHTEIRLRVGRPVVMEAAARLGGDSLPAILCPISTRVDSLPPRYAWRWARRLISCPGKRAGGRCPFPVCALRGRHP